MINFVSEHNKNEVIPQAIFWRSLKYFSPQISKAIDDLDEFDYVSFSLDEWINFDLRRYRAHPLFIAILYLPVSVDNQVHETTDQIMKGMEVPARAVAWRRGQDFKFGKLTRPRGDRLTEKEARLLCLKIASTFPERQASTAEIKEHVPDYYEPSSLDLLPSKTRKREKMWQQIVGNVISHRESRAGVFAKGFAERTRNGLRVSERGLDYLNKLGFPT
jgi:hypothetical protein